MIEVTERAATAVAQAEAAARRFNPQVRGIRSACSDGGVRFEFTDEPPEGDDEAPEAADAFVEPGLEGTLDTGDHNAPVLIV